MRRVDLVAGIALLFMGMLALPSGCGGGTGDLSACPGGPDCTCSGQSCTCDPEKGCSFACTTDNCKIACGTNGTCEGSCAKDCNASCPEGSQCTIGLGQSGDIKCTNAECDITASDEADITCSGGTCDITCTNRCDIACTDGATCRVKCAGDSDFKPVETAAKCGG